MSEITTRDKLACARRELAMRQAAYPKWIGKRMTQAQADHEIAVMAAIVDDYRRQAEREGA